MISTFLHDEIKLTVSNNTLLEKRSVWRRSILDNNGKLSLPRYMSGQIPYFYRDPLSIAKDFSNQYDALSLIADICRKPPTEETHRCSHFAEILACIYIQKVLGLKLLMRKLTQLTAENTNVHKMDIMCVNTSCIPYKYVWFEVKSSRRSEKSCYHRHGIYKQMRESLEKYTIGDRRFDFVEIRDNLNDAEFLPEEIERIRADLIPPGPTITFQGIAVINIGTISNDDDDYLLTEECSTKFDARILALTDLKATAVSSYNILQEVLRVAEDGI